ncbi:MAG: hypothetical protein WCO98_07605 [bacterium]
MYSKTNKERVLDYLWQIAPEKATNKQIAKDAGLVSHQVAYMLTQELLRNRQIIGERGNGNWLFTVNPATSLKTPHGDMRLTASGSVFYDPKRLKASIEKELGNKTKCKKWGGTVPGFPKDFDFVSEDGTIVADIAQISMVSGEKLMLAKFSMVSEMVWLIEKAPAERRILIFTGDTEELPTNWLKRLGSLTAVEFFFIDEFGKMKQLK